MISISQIQEFSQKIAEIFQPDRIILFGSYASGKPTEDSDVDLLVILPFEESAVDKAIAIRQQHKAPFPLDLITRTPQHIEQRMEMGDFFIRDILQNGRVLYETNHGRVGSESRR
ncbi:MAG: nucleotidyltransferase domain-containing protein [Synechococcales cyanobacterium]